VAAQELVAAAQAALAAASVLMSWPLRCAAGMEEMAGLVQVLERPAIRWVFFPQELLREELAEIMAAAVAAEIPCTAPVVMAATLRHLVAPVAPEVMAPSMAEEAAAQEVAQPLERAAPEAVGILSLRSSSKHETLGFN